MFTRKPRLQPEEFVINSAKRLLQHNLPIADILYGQGHEQALEQSANRRLATLKRIAH